MKGMVSFKILLAGCALMLSVSLNAETYWIDGSGQVVRDGSGDCVIGFHGTAFPECGDIPIARAETDSDGDGVPDSRDRCPGTPAGVRVDATGCPLDSDGDGVADYLDKCPGTPAGVAVDASGCPLDGDGDGVPDYLDKCPNTPPGSTVDAQGCPEKIVLRNLNFASNSSVLNAESRANLDRVLIGIKDNPAITQITVTGHTDSQGTADYNKDLSDRRAKAVADYLREQGLDGVTIHSVGMGEENPIATNATPEGRAENRRVEIDLEQ
ncbi:MAG: OmpA family protein [Pseudomonadota bacterium]